MAIVRVMSRIPYLRREELGPEGQQLWDAIVNGRDDLVVTAEGGLAGPFNAFVTAPGAGRRLTSLGDQLWITALAVRGASWLMTDSWPAPDQPGALPHLRRLAAHAAVRDPIATAFGPTAAGPSGRPRPALCPRR